MIIQLACSQKIPPVSVAVFNCAAKVRKKGSTSPFACTFEKVVEVIDHVMTNKIEQS